MSTEVYGKLQHLGRGTFGNVYLCEKVHNKQKVVIKMIECSNEVKTSKEFIKAKNEAGILKMLKHQNIIEYYDSYLKENVFHIVMEYAIHGTLYEYIAKNLHNLMTKEWVLSTFCQILLGLHYVHSKSIIHRDLKSENIFLSGVNENLVKIGDFGISKLLQPNNKTSTSIGTPNYLAPEICEGQPYDQKSDIWSLGCILYELCAMDRLFDGPMAKVIMDIKYRQIKPINIEIYGYGINELIDSMLYFDPNHRPRTTNLLAHHEVAPTCGRLRVNIGHFAPPA